MVTFVFAVDVNESDLVEIDAAICSCRAAALAPVPAGGWGPVTNADRFAWLLEMLRDDADPIFANCHAVAALNEEEIA